MIDRAALKKPALLILGLVMIFGLGFVLIDRTPDYLTTTTLASANSRPFAGGQSVSLGGMVVFGTVEKNKAMTRFILTDLKNDIPVEYDDAAPHTLREGEGIIAIGTYDGTFHASRLIPLRNKDYVSPDIAMIIKNHGSTNK